MTFSRSSRALLLLIAITVLLCTVGYYIGSNSPDGLESVAQRFGFGEKAPAGPAPGALARTAAAFFGAGLCFIAAWGIGKYSATHRRDR